MQLTFNIHWWFFSGHVIHIYTHWYVLGWQMVIQVLTGNQMDLRDLTGLGTSCYYLHLLSKSHLYATFNPEAMIQIHESYFHIVELFIMRYKVLLTTIHMEAIEQYFCVVLF